MSKPVEMLKDERVIKSIWWNDADGSCILVGELDVTKIVCYGEPSMYCNIPFFAVYKGEEISSRIPATQVQVVYKEC